MANLRVPKNGLMRTGKRVHCKLTGCIGGEDGRRSAILLSGAKISVDRGTAHLIK